MKTYSKKIKAINFTTDILLSIILVSIFSFTFILTFSLNPKPSSEYKYVLGLTSNDFKILNKDNFTYEIKEAKDNNINIDINLKGLHNDISNEFNLFEIRNTSLDIEKYLIYFDFKESQYRNFQVYLSSNDSLTTIYEGRSDYPIIIDQKLDLLPQSLTRINLKIISLSEEIPDNVDMNINIKKI